MKRCTMLLCILVGILSCEDFSKGRKVPMKVISIENSKFYLDSLPYDGKYDFEKSKNIFFENLSVGQIVLCKMSKDGSILTIQQ